MTQCDGWADFMVTFRARSVALAGAIAVGVLCEAFISAPAQAQTFVGAFGDTTDLDASLELFNSSDVDGRHGVHGQLVGHLSGIY